LFNPRLITTQLGSVGLIEQLAVLTGTVNDSPQPIKPHESCAELLKFLTPNMVPVSCEPLKTLALTTFPSPQLLTWNVTAKDFCP
jgi:hypothetical protein